MARSNRPGCDVSVGRCIGDVATIADVARALVAPPIEHPLKRLQQGQAGRIWCCASDSRQDDVVLFAQRIGKPDVPPAQTPVIVGYSNPHFLMTSLCPSRSPRPADHVSLLALACSLERFGECASAVFANFRLMATNEGQSHRPSA